MAGEYARHFTNKELVVGSGMEARLRKALLARITRDMLTELHAAHCSSHNCVVKVIAHKSSITEAELLAVCSSAQSMWL